MAPKFTDPETVFRYVLKGHEDAIAFCLLICHILHIWDDLEDRDKKLSRETIDQAFYGALIVLPRNPFYQAHFLELNTMVESAIQNWHAANAMERSDSLDDKRIAFIIRSEYGNIVLTAARIVGGYAWAKEVAPELRRWWHDEGFEGYMENLAQQFNDEKELDHVLG